jgi:hypothetical protein
MNTKNSIISNITAVIIDIAVDFITEMLNIILS